MVPLQVGVYPRHIREESGVATTSAPVGLAIVGRTGRRDPSFVQVYGGQAARRSMVGIGA